ncbi:MAG: transglycosylase SLT domain-containing protein [Betaproteobacteria bacterium]|nr:transglycosylase SLT domain-containing protein [Betaproteobacteria bacterium]
MARVQLLKGYAMAHPDQFQGHMENFANTPFGQKLMQQLPQYTPTGAMPSPDASQPGQGGQQSSAQPANVLPEATTSFLQERYAGTRQGHFDVNPAFGSRLQNALNDAEQAAGGLSTVLSLKRTNAEQASAYRNYMMGGGIAARPGHSLHEIGDAADLKQDVVWQWLRSTDPKTGQPRAANYGLEFLPDRLNDKGHIQLMKQFRGGGTTVVPASAPATVAPSQAPASSVSNASPGQITSGPLPAPNVHPQDMTIDDLWPRIIQRESGGDQSAVSPKGAVGVAQVMPGTAPEAAALAGVPFDANRYKSDPAYNEQLGRAYFTKQWQDFGGDATKALAAYNAGPQKTRDAIAKYGPNWLAHMPAETQGYVSKILGTQVADSGQITSDATANTPITPDSGAPEIFHGIAPKDLFQIQSEVLQAQKSQAAAQREQAKQLNDDTANSYVSRILKNDPKDVANIVQEIAADPNLTNFETKKTLADLADKYQVGTSRQLGAGFSKALGDITSNKITDVNDIYKRALPGGDLTLDGADRLVGIMQKGQKSTDNAAVNTSRDAMLKYAHSKLSFDQEVMFPGLPPLKDAKGEQIYNAQFVPKFEAAFDQWLKEGKNPYDFLTQKNVDTMVEGLRPANQMNADRVNAGMDQSSGDTVGNIPVAPNGANAKNWSSLLQMAPIRPDGSRLPPDKWGEALSILWNASQTQSLEDFKKTTDLFNSHFAVSGTDAKTVLEQMAPEAKP